MKFKLMHPLISCLCILRSDEQLTAKTIICFIWQNYPNKELIISYETGDQISKSNLEYVLPKDQNNIIMIERSSTFSYELARTLALNRAQGEYVCFWDIDTLHDRSRLSCQYNSIQEDGKFFEASILTRIVLHSGVDGNTYISKVRDWASTLLCKKSEVINTMYLANKVDFLELIVDKFRKKKLLKIINDHPFIYIYIYGSTSKLSKNNFRLLCKLSINLDDPKLAYFKKHFEDNFQILLK